MIKYILLIVTAITLVSCDPDVPGEGINLPPMEFAFKVSPDSAYIKVGDTLTLYGGISATLSNGLKLKDGEGEIWALVSRGEEIPKRSFDDIEIPLNGIHYNLIIERGGVKWNQSNPNQIHSFTATPQDDSIVMQYKFVFLINGLYQIGGFQSSFYEGSKGKTRWDAYFDVENPNWDKFWNVPESAAPTLGEYGYDKRFFIAVTE